MKKKFLIAYSFIIIIFGLCIYLKINSLQGMAVNEKEHKSSSSWIVEYTKLSGKKQTYFVLKQKKTITIGVHTNSGKLKVILTDFNNNIVYEDNFKSSITESIKLDPDKYTITIEGISYNGSFSINF